MNIVLIMYMMTKHLNNKFIKIQQDSLYVVLFKDIMRQFSHMDKLEQEKHLQWKDLSTTCMMKKEVLFQEQFKIFLDIFKVAKIKT
jgi:hypothetical protein